MGHAVEPDFIAGLSSVAERYRAILCDVWGVVHNGLEPFPAAVEALSLFRSTGGAVVLLTNAPRPEGAVRIQLDGIGVDHSAYDRIVTSGDVARGLLAERAGARVFHLGPDRDLSLYQDLDVELCDSDSADLICCTGLVQDEIETVDDYDALLRDLAERGCPMICANPDIWVERGNRLLPCAGALAERYRAIGAETLVVGKPFARIYELAMEEVSDILGLPVGRNEVLAVGDGANTDIRGANHAGIDSLFITAGVHAGEYGPDDARTVRLFLGRSNAIVSGLMPRLAW